MPLALLRCDASGRIGGGHVVRSMALAQALSEAGWECVFATRAASLETVPALARAKVLLLRGTDADESAEIAAAMGGKAALAVVDHYERGQAFEQACRSWADQILSIDDATGRDHACDILVDAARSQMDGAPDTRPVGSRAMYGPAYALLKPDFHQLRHASLAARSSGGPIRKIVLSFGMVDAGDRTSQIFEQLSDALPKSCEVEVLMGPKAPAVARVRRMVDESPLDAHVIVDAPDVPQRLAAADLAIGAAGTTSWERCCLGLPALAVVTVSNQRPIADILLNAKAAMMIGTETAVDRHALRDGLVELQKNSQTLSAMSRNAATLCDGLGAQRISIEVAPERTSDGYAVRLRPVTNTDAMRIFEWQSEPSTRRYFRNASVPSYDEHRAWLQTKLDDGNCTLNMVMLGGECAGVLRLDRFDEITYEVSILTAPACKRRGVASAALRLARRLLPRGEFRAEVQDENEASRNLFLSCGYEPAAQGFVLHPAATAHVG